MEKRERGEKDRIAVTPEGKYKSRWQISIDLNDLM